jgi:hypothetical protein
MSQTSRPSKAAREGRKIPHKIFSANSRAKISRASFALNFALYNYAFFQKG